MLNSLQREPQEQRQPSSLEIACGGRLLLVQTPADITLKDGRLFRVVDLQAWGYSPFGILAVGYFTEDDGPEVAEEEWESRLFAADVIHDIRFNKARYEAIIEEIRAEEEAGNEAEAPEEEPAVEDEPVYAEAA